MNTSCLKEQKEKEDQIILKSIFKEPNVYKVLYLGVVFAVL